MNSQFGFSFLEILIALVLVSVTGLGLYSLTAEIEARQYNAKLAEGAMHIANDQLALWQRINTDTPCSAKNGEKVGLSNIAGCLIETKDTPYQLEAKTTKNLMGKTGPYAKQLEIIVSWKDSRGISQSLTFYFTASIHRHD